jgi:hypothetical protein
MKSILGIAAAVVSIAILAGTANAGIVHHVLVSDAENARVLEFEMDGTYVGVFADFTGGRPSGIAQDSSYNVHIANAVDGGAVRRFSTDGTELSPTFNGLTDVKPDDIALDGDGTLFFGNPFGTAADGVYRVDSQTSATEVLDDDDFDAAPRGITFDGDGNLIVADRTQTDGGGELESFDPGNSFASNGALITDEPFIEAPIYYDGSIFYTFQLGVDDNDPEYPGGPNEIKFVVREISASDGTILNTFDHPDFDALLLDTIILPDGDLLVCGFTDDAVFRYDSVDGWSTFATGDFGTGTAMDGPSFMSVMTIIPEPASFALLSLGAVALLCCRRRRR